MRSDTQLRRGRLGRTRTATALAAAGALIMSAGLVLVASSAAQADQHNEPCVPQAAWTETIQHPAVTHTEQQQTSPGQPYIAPTPEVWANWAPNHTTGPQDYVPIWPEDDRGTWIVHEQGVPPGHADEPNGVYQQGAGNSPWFYKQAGSPGQEFIAPSFTTVTIVDQAAWTETINHPAVTCDDTPPPPGPPADVCPNLPGNQAEVPDGYALEDGVCAEVLGEETVVPKPKPEKPEKPGKKPTVKGVQAVAPPAAAPAAAPTAVAAGLGAPASSPLQTIAQMLVAGGMLLLMAGAWIGLGRRETGTHAA